MRDVRGKRFAVAIAMLGCAACQFTSEPIAQGSNVNGVNTGDDVFGTGGAGATSNDGSGGTSANGSGGSNGGASGSVASIGGRGGSGGNGRAGTPVASAGNGANAGRGGAPTTHTGGSGTAGASAGSGANGSGGSNGGSGDGASGSGGTGDVPFCMRPGNSGMDCDDGVFCTVGETCQNSFCQGGTPRDCSAVWTSASPAVQTCNSFICNEDHDACELVPHADNSGCEDGVYCTGDDRCIAGICQAGTVPPCGVGGPLCKAIQCNEQNKSCDLVATDEGMSCVMNDGCADPKVCRAGACVLANTTCDQGSTCSLTCGNPCSCQEDCAPGSACTIDCAAGSICTSSCQQAQSCNTTCRSPECVIDCQGAGDCKSDCSLGCQVDCRNADKCELTCGQNAPCEIDCRGAADCSKIDCPSGQCVLRCDPKIQGMGNANNCQFKSCGRDVSSTVLDCGNGVFVCNRNCPSSLPP